MTDDRDPMAERRRNSRAHYDAVDAAIAARPTPPTHITRTRAVLDGLEVTVDDGKGTAIRVTAHDDSPGRMTLAVETHTSLVEVEVPAFTVTALVEALAAVAELGNAAPIVGHR